MCNRQTGGAAVLSTLAVAFNWLASYVKTARLYHFHLLNSVVFLVAPQCQSSHGTLFLWRSLFDVYRETN
jgi:hypothetical protein